MQTPQTTTTPSAPSPVPQASAKNVAAVRAIYEAFGRGDVPAILAQLAPDVEWEMDAGQHGIPYLQAGRGHGAALRFLESLARTLEVTAFRPFALLADGEWVVALVAIELRVRATGATFAEACEPHVWRLDDSGKVIAFRHAADTHRHRVALGMD